MKVKLNNQSFELPGELGSIQQLLEMASLTGPGKAVALNGRLVRREEYAATTLKEGDDVMVIGAAYGG